MDRCPICGSRLFLEHARYETEGDNSPETQTKVYHVADRVCKNPACAGCGKTADIARTVIYQSPQQISKE